MENSFPGKLIRETLADCESVRQMVESLVLGRDSNQRRQSPRFPTVAALSGQARLSRAHGHLLCLKTVQLPFMGLMPTSDNDPGQAESEGGSIATELLHGISDVRVINFSEEGLQLELECENFFSFLDRPILVRFKGKHHPVNLRWYKQSGKVVRCGCSFSEDVEREPNLARTLLNFSNDLVRYMSASEIKRMRPPFETVFSSMSIYQNLRLKYLEAVASFHETKTFILQCLNPKFHDRVEHVFEQFRYSKSFQRDEAAKRAGDRAYAAAVDVFLLPCRELGCGLLEVGEQTLLMWEEASNLLRSCLLPLEPEPDSSEFICDAVKPIYNSFLTLRGRLPGVFDDKLIDRQFRGYSTLIGEIVHLREQLIDCVSGVGRR